jgi:hypothetical protein
MPPWTDQAALLPCFPCIFSVRTESISLGPEEMSPCDSLSLLSVLACTATSKEFPRVHAFNNLTERGKEKDFEF